MIGKGSTTVWLLALFSSAMCFLLFYISDHLNVLLSPQSQRNPSFKGERRLTPVDFKERERTLMPVDFKEGERNLTSVGLKEGKRNQPSVDFKEGERNLPSVSFKERERNLPSVRFKQQERKLPSVSFKGEKKLPSVTLKDGERNPPSVSFKEERNLTSADFKKARDKRNLTSTSVTETRPRLVLIYTAFFSLYPWEGLEDTHKFTYFQGKPCRFQNCVLSYKKEEFSSSDVVIFHGRNMPSVNKLRELHSKRSSNQAWVFFLLESPAHSPDTSQYDGLFNWTMTYRRDSDIYHPYGFFAPLGADDKNPEVSTDYSLGKDKLIVWTVSNCAGKRFSYVNKLKQLVKVDVFGGCGRNSCPRRGGDITEDCINVLRSYKFQLAFENTECLDYVTEKYWGSPLENGIVPIVMGGADYKEIAIPGSYINVLDFPSAKALADYLLYLDKNDTAYNEYFHWKTKYKLGGCLHGGDLSRHYHWTCDLCALANNASAESKIYEHLEDFWSKKQCNQFSEQFDKIINQ